MNIDKFLEGFELFIKEAGVSPSVAVTLRQCLAVVDMDKLTKEAGRNILLNPLVQRAIRAAAKGEAVGVAEQEGKNIAQTLGRTARIGRDVLGPEGNMAQVGGGRMLRIGDNPPIMGGNSAKIGVPNARPEPTAPGWMRSAANALGRGAASAGNFLKNHKLGTTLVAGVPATAGLAALRGDPSAPAPVAPKGGAGGTTNDNGPWYTSPGFVLPAAFSTAAAAYLAHKLGDTEKARD